ncbi:MAG: phosphodiester glycosidase family protein [Pedobacter sp.]|nr:MAG: phosphodiester glycosidase family protein [Pedobacter sp.]
MKKHLLFSFLFFCYGYSSFAQNADSIAVVTAAWDKQQIASKTNLLTYHFNQKNLFAANQFISYVEINRKGNAPVFAFGNEVKTKKTTSTFGQELDALAAINGTFFDVANGGSVDFVRMDGVVTNKNIIGKNGKRARHQETAMVINKKGQLALKKWDKTEDWEYKLPEKNVMLSGPLLVLDNIVEELDTTSFTRARHPRSAIGIKADGKIILVTVDGRQENSAGMSLHELTKLMRWLGCVSAINLDGGGSTTLWTAKNGVVNFPSDNKLWDHKGERKVANVIILKKK